MIGRIRGILLHKAPPLLMVEAGGLGYELEAPLSLFAELPETGREVTLLTHFMVKEDRHTLYAFVDEPQRDLFRQLLAISGVGGKLALAMLSALSAAELHRCVVENDLTTLCRIPGIGRKTAQRLVLELKDRLGDSSPTLSGTPVTLPPASPMAEARAALEALGYKSTEAERMLAAVDGGGQLDTETLIRKALAQALGGRG